MPGDFDTVKERVDIVQLIGERVPLRKAGRAYKGLCPFHNEKTPSFTVDPDRRTYKCFGCLPPGSLIKTGEGPRAIESIRTGDRVYAGDGRLHAVQLTHEHLFDGELVELTCAPFKIPILLTPNHEVPVFRPKSRRVERVEAGALRPQNYLMYPAVERTATPLDWSPLPEWFGSRGKHPKALPRSVDEVAFGEWLGWYVAEGSVSNDRSVRFSLSGDEASIAERLDELTFRLFGERLRITNYGSRLEAWFCHALLSRWLKHHCGDGSKNKHLPDFVWGWRTQTQWALFLALMRGDGRMTRRSYVARYGYFAQGSWTLSSASSRLTDDVRDLLIANGVVPSIRGDTQADGRRSWRVTVTEDVQGRWGSGERSPSTVVPVRIRKVDHVRYEGPVYNLSIEEEHTYLTLSGTVCNCGEGGDVFTWLQKMDNLEPVEALKVLAERAGVELSSWAPKEDERRKRLLAAQDTAHFYFRQALRSPRGATTAAYVAERGVTAAMVEKFGIGYAPDLRDGLLTYLRKKGFTDEEGVASGLLVQTERSGLIDRFRDRLIVPIRDAKGRVIAFGGRAMRADQPGKYINSPQTVLFSKSGTLYGLDVARPAIRKKSEAVIVEGYFDAIVMHQAGFDNAVASMGTALTEEQYRVLDDMKVDRAVVAFDADEAGTRSAEARGRELARIAQRASRRAGRGSLAARTGLGVYVAVLPKGDPDEMARADPAGLREVLGAAKPVLEFVIDRAVLRHDLARPDGRRKFLAETLPLLADEPDALTRELYLGTLSRLTGVAQESLRAEAPESKRDAGPARASGAQAGVPSAPPAVADQKKQTPSLERFLMALLTRFPEEAARADLAPSDLADPAYRAIFELLRSGRPLSELPAHLAAVSAALGAEAPEPETETDTGRAIEILALRLREQVLRGRLGDARAALQRADGGDVGGLDSEVTRLTDELGELMKVREQRTALRVEQQEEDA